MTWLDLHFRQDNDQALPDHPGDRLLKKQNALLGGLSSEVWNCCLILEPG